MNEPIKTLQMQTYSILKERIISGIYPAGFHMQEGQIAEELGISRSPVREALKILSSEGFLNNLPNRGIFVRTYTKKDVEEFFRARNMIESYAMRNIPLPLVKERIVYLRALKKGFERDRTNPDESIKHDAYLHSAIINFCDNSYVTKMYENIDGIAMMFRLNALRDGLDAISFEQYIGSQIGIIDALLKGDITRAIEINTEHLGRACRIIAATIEKPE